MLLPPMYTTFTNSVPFIIEPPSLFARETGEKLLSRDNSCSKIRQKKTFISNAVLTENANLAEPLNRWLCRYCCMQCGRIGTFQKRARATAVRRLHGRLWSGLPLLNTRGKYVIHISLCSSFQPFLASINSICLYINACGYYVRASISIHEGCTSRLKLTMHINLSSANLHPFRYVPHTICTIRNS